MKKIILIALAAMLCSASACSQASNIDPAALATKPTANTQSQSTTAQAFTEELTTAAPTTEEVTETETVTEEPTTQKPTDPPRDESWKQLYIDYLNTLDDSMYEGYQLIFVDEDDVPELVVSSGAHIIPGYLCWVNDGKLCQSSKSYSGFAYLEKQNRYLCEEGFSGVGWDYVRKISGSEAVDIVKGEVKNLQGSESYSWDGVSYSSKSDYEAAKSKDFDKSAAKTAGDLKSLEDICNEIRNF